MAKAGNFCDAGHPIDLSWKSCPYCKAEGKEKATLSPSDSPDMNQDQPHISVDQLVKIFISYAREDEPIARRLFLELEPIPGVKLWRDKESLLPGSHWENEITNALKESDLVIVLLSSRAITKEGFIQKEIYKILDLQKYRPPDEVFCIPLRLDDCNPKHPELKELHQLDLFEDWYGCISK